MQHAAIAAAAILATLACAATARAEDCGPLKRAVSLDMQPGPGGGPRMMVPINVNGVARNFILATDDRITRLTDKTVADLALKPVSGKGKMLARNGTSSAASTVTVDFTIGPIAARQRVAPIEPGHETQIDGIMAPDLMGYYDIEMDFAGRKLNYFLPDHCEGRVVYWPNSAVAVVPYRGFDASAGTPDMTVPVTLDGHDVIARISTSEPRSILDAASALSLFNLTSDTAGAVPMGTIAGTTDQKLFGWTFKKLQIGDITVSNARLEVMPDLIGSKDQDMLRSESRVKRITDHYQPTLVLGMDILSKLHLYIAAKEKKLYVTGASAAVSAPAAAP